MFSCFYLSLLSMFYLSCRLSAQGADTSIDLSWLFLTHLQLQKAPNKQEKCSLRLGMHNLDFRSVYTEYLACLIYDGWGQ